MLKPPPAGMSHVWPPTGPASPATWLRGLFALSLILAVGNSQGAASLPPVLTAIVAGAYLGLQALLAWRVRRAPVTAFSAAPLILDALFAFLPALAAAQPPGSGGLCLALLVTANAPAYPGRRLVIALLPALLTWFAVTLGQTATRQDDQQAELASLAVLLTAGSWMTALRVRKLTADAARTPGTDPLTGLGNRAVLNDAARYLIPYQQRNRTPLVLMLCEIELLEDKTGRKTRSSLLRRCITQFSAIIDSRLRACDVAVYYGENRFAFLLTDTHHKGAERVAGDLGEPFERWAAESGIHAILRTGIAPLPLETLAIDQVMIRLIHAVETTRTHAPQRRQPVFIDPAQLRESS